MKKGQISKFGKTVILMIIFVVIIAGVVMKLPSYAKNIKNLINNHLPSNISINCEYVTNCADYNVFKDGEEGCKIDFCKIGRQNKKCYPTYTPNPPPTYKTNEPWYSFKSCEECPKTCNCDFYKYNFEELKKNNPCGCTGC